MPLHTKPGGIWYRPWNPIGGLQKQQGSMYRPMAHDACWFAALTAAASEGDQRFRGDEWRAWDDLHVVPQQPSAAVVGQLGLPFTQVTRQLGLWSRPAMRIHLRMDQKRTAQILLDFRFLLPAGYATGFHVCILFFSYFLYIFYKLLPHCFHWLLSSRPWMVEHQVSDIRHLYSPPWW